MNLIVDPDPMNHLGPVNHLDPVNPVDPDRLDHLVQWVIRVIRVILDHQELGHLVKMV